MKKPYLKFFYLFYGICFLATCTPLVKVANLPVLWLGLPALVTYLVGWSILALLALTLQLKVDKKFEAKHRAEYQKMADQGE